MNASLINPFLTSSVQVVETLISIRPVVGKVQILDMHYREGYLWLKIGILGELEKDILFGFPESVGVGVVSRMMGGYSFAGWDDICRSGVAELANMISGNASTFLAQNGYEIDITPPKILSESESLWGGKAFSVPLTIEGLGEFYMNIPM